MTARLPMSRMLLQVPGGLRRGSPAHPRVTLGVQRLRETAQAGMLRACRGSASAVRWILMAATGRDPAGPGQLTSRDGGAYTAHGAPWRVLRVAVRGRENGGRLAVVSALKPLAGNRGEVPSSPAQGRRLLAGQGMRGRRNPGSETAHWASTRGLSARQAFHVRAPARTGTGIRSARAAGRTWPGRDVPPLQPGCGPLEQAPLLAAARPDWLYQAAADPELGCQRAGPAGTRRRPGWQS